MLYRNQTVDFLLTLLSPQHHRNLRSRSWIKKMRTFKHRNREFSAKGKLTGGCTVSEVFRATGIFRRCRPALDWPILYENRNEKFIWHYKEKRETTDDLNKTSQLQRIIMDSVQPPIRYSTYVIGSPEANLVQDQLKELNLTIETNYWRRITIYINPRVEMATAWAEYLCSFIGDNFAYDMMTDSFNPNSPCLLELLPSLPRVAVRIDKNCLLSCS